MFTPQQRHMSGITSELFVAQKLSVVGYEIFWPLMTQSKIDFLAVKEAEILKVQVKKASWSTTGPYQYLQCRLHGRSRRDIKKWYTKEDVDFYAITDNERVWWIPFSEMGHQTSVCLDCTNPNYKQQTKYDAKLWLI